MSEQSINNTQDKQPLKLLNLGGRTFAPSEQVPIPEWPCTTTQRIQPTLTLKDDDLFLITDQLGNISGCEADHAHLSLGLLCKDTRFLSRLELQIEGQAPILLSSTARQGFALSALCANPYIEGKIEAETIGIERNIVLQGALFEELTLTNYNTEAVDFEISISFDADFLDLFVIRGAVRHANGTILRLVGKSEMDFNHASQDIHGVVEETGELTLAYQGLDGIFMESRIRFDHRQPDYFKGYTAIWQMQLNPHETQSVGYCLQPFVDGQLASAVSPPANFKQALAAELSEEQKWRDRATKIRTDNQELNLIIERAEEDIYLLGQTFGEGKVLSAGVPWFSTLFGRDSIIAAAQTLIFSPEIARHTLLTLASYQGQVDNEWREEQPGKILHEIRFGEMARCGEVPHTPYYGTVDATPLWILLYAQYYSWTHDDELLKGLWDNALKAMDWIDRNCKETGYLPYQCKSPGGLQNQGWKDSANCIVDSQGRLAEGNIYLCEVQGYVYGAKMALSRLARLRKEHDLANKLEKEAHDLKIRFNEDFWLPEAEYIALGLNDDGKPIDSITSNPGHCLGLDILLPDKAQSVAERLQGPDLFSGWGIRTLSSLSPAYNPMGYHLGSVWPHDNGIIAVGLRSLNRVEQSLEVAQGIIDMTVHQPYFRPPELFCGYTRLPHSSPVRYPVACTPQAWATGTIFQFLQIMANLIPDAANNCLQIVHPSLPDSIQFLCLENLKIGQTLLDLEFERSGNATACRVVRKRGNLRVIIEA
ncbi:amylo-alpha-1,6-glucosidase [Crocosphaera chwakensis]|uniref:Amylo-alpha-1,6-glucosidase n=1 Tax=Crocosphaera chwakensis CCY0110 TaxID=391612 RepID=A3IKS7_9CHRO|nr:amylo-alpha-1,6-glucosidase [Crocosphaera chwakensis]EAZ92796.1 Amylo-alpha-1,6-glucosidase [Crocosphaera chwakensis CCY0110]